LGPFPQLFGQACTFAALAVHKKAAFSFSILLKLAQKKGFGNIQPFFTQK